jgi:hypothetical protein
MRLLLSGEGPSDLGQCIYPLALCDGEDFQHGPMTRLLLSLLSMQANIQPAISYISKAELVAATKQQKPNRMNRIRGKKTGAETRYFYDNAKSLGMKAKQLAEDLKDVVIAIFFRDVDGTNSHPGRWADKVKSVQEGFLAAAFELGVPMLPTPKSEAWLLCIATGQAGNSCKNLEELPGNDRSPNNAKAKLDDALGEHFNADQLADWVANQPIHFDRLRTMPSFASFEESLTAAIRQTT